MSWQNVVTILSFIIGIVSLVIGAFSLYFSYVSMQRTGKIQNALKEQAEQRFQRDNARNLLPQVEALLEQVQTDYEDLDQVERDIKQVQSVLSQLQNAVDISKIHVEKILKMINENTEGNYNGRPLSHTCQDYIAELSALVIALKKEAD